MASCPVAARSGGPHSLGLLAFSLSSQVFGTKSDLVGTFPFFFFKLVYFTSAFPFSLEGVVAYLSRL